MNDDVRFQAEACVHLLKNMGFVIGGNRDELIREFAAIIAAKSQPSKPKYAPEDHGKTWGNGIDRGPTGGDW